MLTDKKSGTWRAARAWWVLLAVAAFCGGGALDLKAQPAPPNDNLTNNQGIIGVSGTVQGTNLQATAETGELDPVPALAPASTIWYSWTAPVTTEMDFNTRGSVDPSGLTLQTMLGVYRLKTAGTALTYANLTKVAGNEYDASGGPTTNLVTSRVDFAATEGTTYFIQVGSTTNAFDGDGQGRPVLNWSPSLVAGGFGFSTATYIMSSLENYLPDDANHGSVAPSLYGFAQGAANARITVTRTGGFTGRCEVTLTIGPGLYTNIYETNYIGTNLLVTNYAGMPNGTNNVINFTNIFTTNIAWINNFQYYQAGAFEYQIVDGDELVVQTNYGFGPTNGNGPVVVSNSLPITNLEAFGTFGLPDFFTNFPCPGIASHAGTVSNADGSFTVFTTNTFCNRSNMTVVVASAHDNYEFTPLTETLTFDDFQMSQDVYVQIYPILADRPTGVSVVDYPSYGPEDPLILEEFGGDLNYVIGQLNAYVNVSLSNAVLDPLENPDIIPPTISQANALIDIENFWGVPYTTYTNILDISDPKTGLPVYQWSSINFERYTYRCNKTNAPYQTVASIAVQRSERQTAAGASTYTVHYTMDSTLPNITVIDDNKFATVADSDYAVPANSTNQAFYDFTLPTTADWTGVSGMLTFPALSLNAQFIQIPIYTNGAVEFDEDIELQLYLTVGDAQGDLGQPFPGYLGTIDTARLTINFDNIEGDIVQPGGALDRTYNVDNQADSQPPENEVPGADSYVNAVAIDASGKAVIGGDFNLYNGTAINYVARILANGFIDTTFNPGRGPDNFVRAIIVDASGRIVIGGDFLSVNGTPVSHIARLLPSGALDTSFVLGAGFNGSVFALTNDANGNILVGGDFTSFNTTNCNHIARLLPSGGLDATFLPSSGIGLTNGTDQDVHAVALDGLGNIILGGNFSTVNGTNWNHIARLLNNGTLDTSFNPGFGADGNVLALAVQTDNSIILGGAFQNFNLISRSSIARLTPSGTLDTGFAPGTGFNDLVDALIVQPDGKIVVAGQFTMYNGTRRVALARLLNGSGGSTGQGGWLDTSFMDTSYNQFAGLVNHYYNTNAVNTNDYPSSNQRKQVYAMGLQPDGNIVIGGNFVRVGGGFTRTDIRNRSNLARVMGAPTPGVNGTPTLESGPGNCPGNIGMTQSPYTVVDTGFFLFVTMNRTNGSLGPLTLTLGTNTLAPSTSSATAADFGLNESVCTYDTVWSLADEGAGAYGWRKSDGEYGFNNNIQTVNDGGASELLLTINNDPTAAPIIYANLNLLNLNANGLLSLGGVPIPLAPALGQYTSGLDIVNGNFPSGTLGFSATNYNVLESAGTVTITLLRTNGNNGQPSVSVIASNASAINATPPNTSGDFLWNNNNNPEGPFFGYTPVTFTIPIKDYTTPQSNKFFYLYLANPTAGATLNSNVLPSVATVTIIDDHFQPGYLSFSSPTFSVLKPGTATISVTRSGAALGDVSVEVATSNGTAISSVNYVAVTNALLSWTNGDISTKTLTVQTLQDNTVEGPKTVNLYLYNPSVNNNTNLATNQMVLAYPSNAVLTIIDTDTNGYISFLQPTFSVFQNGGQALITVTRTGGTVGSESVNFQTYTLTNVQLPYLAGVAGSNYGATNGQLNFPPGVSSASFTVPVYQVAEASPADRLVGLRLFGGSPTNIAGLFPQNAVLTILDPQLHLNSAGAVDPTLQNGIGFNNTVNSLSLQPDSSLLAGGTFTFFDSYPFDFVGRLQADGSFDTSFLFNQAGANSTVWQVLSQPPSAGQTDGNIMIVGDFTDVDEVASPRIARLTLSGGLDTSFNPGAGADGTVFGIATMLLPTVTTNLNTNYVIVGAFANYDGTPASGVARLTYSGLTDPTFNLGFGATGSNSAVHTLAITPNNQILVGGDFTSFDNQSHHHLVRLNADGSLDTNFTAFDGVTSDINGSVRAIVVQPDGRIIIGGLFTTVSGRNFNYIARLNSDGTTDTNFNVGVGCNSIVLALALDDQLRILVGGSFTQASGVTRNGLTRLNPDGTVDPSINFGFGANGFVDTIVVQTNFEINVGGQFSMFNNIPENNFVRLFGGANAGNGSIQFSEQTYGVVESSTNTNTASIGIQRLGGTFGSPTVSAVFFTTNGTAINGVNYIAVTNTVSFPLGETFETVTVPVLPSTAIGPDLSVNLLLTNPPSNTEATGPQVEATLIITNDNSGVEFAAQGFNQSSTAGSVAIPIVRVGGTNSTVAITVYTGTNGSATPFTNYIPTTNTLTFYPGQVTNYWLITILDSPTTFQDTTVDLEMENPTNTIIASPSSALLTINSVLIGPGFLSFSATNYTVSEGGTNAIITVVRTNGNYNNISVVASVTGGTAIPGVNYLFTNAIVFIPSGTNSATFSIPIVQLTNAEPNLTVDLSLSTPTGGATLISPTQAVVTIINDIAAFEFNNANYLVNEGAGSTTLTILRVGPTNGTATVGYTTYSPPNAAESNGYAVPNIDYVPTNGILTFPPGVALETIPINILQTTNVSSVLSFQVLLDSPSPGTQVGVPGSATVGIIGDVTGFSFPTNAYYVGENGSNVVININRFPATTGALTVQVSATSGSNDTAVAGVDYVATNETLVFANEVTNQTLTVQILNPNLVESNKTFSVILSNPTTNSYLVPPATAVVTITNVYVGLAFGSPSFTVSECSPVAVIPVVLTGLTNSTNYISYGTQDGSGTAGLNYFQTNGTLVFPPGQTVEYIDVTPINNHVIGPDHTVQLNLTNNYPVPPNVAGVQLLTPSTALLTIEECNGAYILKSGTAFVTGSILPSTGVIYSNDTVTILFGLRDIAGGNTTNLVATLLASNGVTNVSGPVNYGTLIESGPTVSQPFTFTAVGSNGQNITATLSLQDSANTNLGTVAFGFTIGGSTISYTNTNTIFLPENAVAPTIATNSVGPGYGYPSLINVSGISGLITKATVTFSNFGHSYPSDVDAVLEGPTGSNSILMSHVGSNYGVGFGLPYNPPVPPVTLTFDQTASASMPVTSRLASGTYLPSTNAYLPEMPKLPPVPTNVSVPVAAPQSPYPYQANLSTFVGSSPNGNWSLWAMCDQTLDTGYISNGWILTISTGVSVESDSDLEVTVTPVPTQATVSNLLTYFVTVTNFGPSAATNVVITDYLPAGAIYLSNSCNCGTVAGGALTIDLPLLTVGAGTAFDVYVLPTGLGYMTNVVTALALEPDPNSNNMITNVNLVNPPSADLGITLTGGPNPVMAGAGVTFTLDLTNGGPSVGVGTVATIVLPSGFLVNSNGITATTGTTTNVNGTITWNIGTLAESVNGSGPTLTVSTTPTAAGTGLCTAFVSSAIFDPLKGNNSSLVKIQVNQPMLSVFSTSGAYQLTWSASATNYTLQGATNLPPPGAAYLWNNIPTPPVSNGMYIFTLPGNNGYHFFRLSAPIP